MNAELVTLPERQVELVLQGRGAPLIVLEAGCTCDLTAWSSVFGDLAGRHETLAYSRPGYGRSTLVDTPRDAPTAASELHELLQALGKAPPYILVGHSYGGLIVQAFAAAYGAEVAGLVLVDPTPLDLIEHMRRDVPEAMAAFYEAWSVATGVARLEFESLHPPRGGHFPGSPYTGPTLVLAARRLEELGFPRMRELWRARRIPETASRYPQAEVRWLSCGHFIQKERPLAVVDAVDEVLARAS